MFALGEQVEPQEEAHLQSCATCRSEAAELAEVVAIGRAAPERLPEVPDRIWVRIRAELDQSSASDSSPEPAGHEIRPTALPPLRADRSFGAAEYPPAANVVHMSPRRNRLFAVAGIAAAVGALVGGTVVWAALDRAGTTDTQPSQGTIVAQAALDPLTPQGAQPGQAKVMDSPDGLIVRVDASSLPAVDGYYEVWLIDKDVSAMVALGALPAGSIGTFTVPPGISIADYPIVDISLEPLDGDPAHSKVSLLRGVLDA
jgi:hypothetical protein